MKTVILSVVLALAMGQSQAAVYQSVAPDKSAITFNYRQMGVAMDGKFRTFSAKLNFDTAHIDKASGRIDIDLVSIDTGSAEADQEVVAKTWLNVAGHPRASFLLGSLRQTAANQYEATGQLELKGVTRELHVPLKLSPQGVLSGSFVIRRADHGIGEGLWAKFDVVANDITVNFNLALK